MVRGQLGQCSFRGEMQNVRGNMMDSPLTLIAILERAGKLFPQVEVVSRGTDHHLHRCTYGDVYRRARKLAQALLQQGLLPGDRVATLMWNHTAHLECYFGIPAAAGILHPLNLRLHPGELAYIVSQARDRFLIVDEVLLPIYESFRPQVALERAFVVRSGHSGILPGFENYENILEASQEDSLRYPTLDENDAAA